MINAIKAGWFAWRASRITKHIDFLNNNRDEALYLIEEAKRSRERMLVKLARIK